MRGLRFATIIISGNVSRVAGKIVHYVIWRAQLHTHTAAEKKPCKATSPHPDLCEVFDKLWKGLGRIKLLLLEKTRAQRTYKIRAMRVRAPNRGKSRRPTCGREFIVCMCVCMYLCETIWRRLLLSVRNTRALWAKNFARSSPARMFGV